MSAVQRIKAVHARNLAVQRSRLASVPEVGIFWLIDDKLVADSIPWRQADIHGGFYNGKNDHAALWTTLQRLLPNGRVWSIPITRAAGCSFIRRKKSFLFIRRKPSSIARK
jgi:hypothetical protein